MSGGCEYAASAPNIQPKREARSLRPPIVRSRTCVGVPVGLGVGEKVGARAVCVGGGEDSGGGVRDLL